MIGLLLLITIYTHQIVHIAHPGYVTFILFINKFYNHCSVVCRRLTQQLSCQSHSCRLQEYLSSWLEAPTAENGDFLVMRLCTLADIGHMRKMGFLTIVGMKLHFSMFCTSPRAVQRSQSSELK